MDFIFHQSLICADLEGHAFESFTFDRVASTGRWLVVAHGADPATVGGGFFRLAEFEVALAGVGGLDGVHASAQSGFFEEVTPAFVGVRRALAVLVFTHGGFGVLPALNDFDYSSGHIGADIVTDEYVGRF